jgi:hypothetical protein
MPWPKSDEEQLLMLRRSVENNCAAAIGALGQCYDMRYLGLVKSHKKAARLYQRAADLGDVKAMFHVGVSYANGQGVKLDKKNAVKFYRMAADRGYVTAQYNLGVSYQNGDGVAQDHTEGFRFCKLAAEQGLTIAEYDLGFAYTKGKGVACDTAEAIRWFERAAAKGHEGAKNTLAKLQVLLLRRTHP